MVNFYPALVNCDPKNKANISDVVGTFLSILLSVIHKMTTNQ